MEPVEKGETNVDNSSDTTKSTTAIVAKKGVTEDDADDTKNVVIAQETEVTVKSSIRKKAKWKPETTSKTLTNKSDHDNVSEPKESEEEGNNNTSDKGDHNSSDPRLTFSSASDSSKDSHDYVKVHCTSTEDAMIESEFLFYPMIGVKDGDDAVDGPLLLERADKGEYDFVVSVERPKMSTCRESPPLSPHPFHQLLQSSNI